MDSVALDEGAQYVVYALDVESIQHSYTTYSADGCCVFCCTLNSVHCPIRKGSDKDITILVSPIVNPQRRIEYITVSTDEGELV